MGRLVLGILKGGIVGAGIGYLAGRGGISTGVLAMFVYAVIGGVVGLICGRPLWRQETVWTPVLKALFGIGIGIGATFLGRSFLNSVYLPFAITAIPDATTRPIPEVPALFGTLVGVLYGAFVEIDDAGARDPGASAKTQR